MQLGPPGIQLPEQRWGAGQHRIQKQHLFPTQGPVGAGVAGRDERAGDRAGRLGVSRGNGRTVTSMETPECEGLLREESGFVAFLVIGPTGS